MTQVRVPHVTINGIEHYNASFTQPLDQQYCPLEYTEYEGLCKNQFHNVQLRPSTTCEHTAECFNLRASLNSLRLDK